MAVQKDSRTITKVLVIWELSSEMGRYEWTRQSGRGTAVGSTQDSERGAKLPRLPQLLLTVHQRIWGLRKTSNPVDAKGLQVVLG